MKDKMFLAFYKMKGRVKDFLKEEKGGSEIIAVILILVVVIALVAIFRTQLIEIVNSLFAKIKEGIGGITG